MQKFWFSKLEPAGRASEYRVGQHLSCRLPFQERFPEGPDEQESAFEFFTGHGSAPGLSTL